MRLMEGWPLLAWPKILLSLRFFLSAASHFGTTVCFQMLYIIIELYIAFNRLYYFRFTNLFFIQYDTDILFYFDNQQNVLNVVTTCKVELLCKQILVKLFWVSNKLSLTYGYFDLWKATNDINNNMDCTKFISDG